MHWNKCLSLMPSEGIMYKMKMLKGYSCIRQSSLMNIATDILDQKVWWWWLYEHKPRRNPSWIKQVGRL